jgi:hypothetical protein
VHASGRVISLKNNFPPNFSSSQAFIISFACP